MTCVLAIVALAGFLQWVSLGETTTENDYAAPFLTPVLAEGPGETTPPSPGPDYNDREPNNTGSGARSGLRMASSSDSQAGADSFPSAASSNLAPTPTASTVEAATARVNAEGGVLTEEEAIAVLRAAGAPEEWIPDMLTIAWCESKYSPHAMGDSGNSLGWFQLWSGWFRAGEDPFDALTNARVAVRVREIRGRFGGAGGWSCAGLNGIM